MYFDTLKFKIAKLNIEKFKNSLLINNLDNSNLGTQSIESRAGRGGITIRDSIPQGGKEVIERETRDIKIIPHKIFLSYIKIKNVLLDF